MQKVQKMASTPQQVNYSDQYAPPRTCRYDALPLVKEDGEWSLEQVDRLAMTIDGVGTQSAAMALPLGRRFAASLYRCRRCGYIELIDEL